MPLMVADNYGSELRRLNDRFCAATGIRRRDCVLDIGCGAGQTSRDAVRAAVAVRFLGRLVSEQLLERANGASTRSVLLLHVAQPQRSPATVCYLASNSKLMNPQLKIATRFRALPALSREARQVDDSMVRLCTVRHELMHVIDYQQEARGIVCELQPHSIEHRRASVARITEIW